jgi:hypothetical protein
MKPRGTWPGKFSEIISDKDELFNGQQRKAHRMNLVQSAGQKLFESGDQLRHEITDGGRLRIGELGR